MSGDPAVRRGALQPTPAVVQGELKGWWASKRGVPKILGHSWVQPGKIFHDFGSRPTKFEKHIRTKQENAVGQCPSIIFD